MSEQPKVSVIIPVYNTEKYLRECLDSVVNQTLRDIEIICINDGSTDGSLAILEEYQQRDPRITVLSEKNRGVNAVRNQGLEVSRGKYIYFIDSDDYAELNLLEKTVKLADELALDAVVFGVDQIVETDKGGWVHPASRRSADEPPMLLSGVEYIRHAKEEGTYVSTVWTMIWRREILFDNDIRFKEAKYYQDALFCLQAYLASRRLLLIADKLYHYRKRPESITAKPNTHYNTENFFQCATGILEYAFRKPHTPEEEWEICQEYKRNVEEARRKYHSLTAEEQAKVSFSTEIEMEMFRQIVMSGYGLDVVHTSRSYRIGRAITWLPRKIRGGVRCLRENGLRYTLLRAREKMRRGLRR